MVEDRLSTGTGFFGPATREHPVTECPRIVPGRLVPLENLVEDFNCTVIVKRETLLETLLLGLTIDSIAQNFGFFFQRH